MNIRDPILHERKIKTIYPKILFHKCKICGYEFKHTTMWSWIDDWDYEGQSNRSYACTSCVPDLKDLFPHISGYKSLEHSTPIPPKGGSGQISL